MRKLGNILLGIIFSFVLLFSGVARQNQTAFASSFQMSYMDYSAKVQSILNEFCEFKTRIAGSENEKEASEYIKNYLLNNANKLSPKSNASTIDGIQNFDFMSDYSEIYESSQNIVFEYKSSIKTDKKVILACNYDAPVKYDEDTEEYVSYNNDALNASASSVATMLILAETLPNCNLSYNLEFVFFGAGESSFAGSGFYLNGLSEDEAKNVLCVINIDEVAFGNNMYFYMNEIETSFSKYVAKVCSPFAKEVDISHLNKTEFVESGLNLGYSHIGLDSDNVNFMKRGIATINIFAGDYETGIVMGRNEYDGKTPMTYTDNDTLEYASKNLGLTEIVDNLYSVNLSIETLLTDAGFVKNASESFGKTSWFYSIFASYELVLLLTIIAFVVVLIVAMYIYYKLTVKSYYANIEVEFLSSVVKISDQVDKNAENKDVAKVVGQVLANDIKRNKTLKPEKKKKDK